MSEIKIDKNYSISPDSHGWRLTYSEERKPKGGTPYTYQDHWYFPTIKDALEKYTDLDLREATDLSDIIEHINNLKEVIEKLAPKIYVANGKLITP